MQTRTGSGRDEVLPDRRPTNHYGARACEHLMNASDRLLASTCMPSNRLCYRRYLAVQADWLSGVTGVLGPFLYASQDVL